MDRLIKAMGAGEPLKITAIDSREMTRRAQEIHRMSPLAAAALGRCLTAASMMGIELKDPNGSITLQVNGHGVLGHILAVANNEGMVRGYLQNPGAELPLRADRKLDVGKGVGEGTLTVIKDIGFNEPFHGTIELVGGEIASDIAAYFMESEQIPTVCALGVLVGTDGWVAQAGGYLIQLMPGASDCVVERLEQAARKAQPISKMLGEGLSLEEILRQTLDSFSIEVLEEHAVAYRCFCSPERVKRVLFSLGKGELEELIAADEDIEITCQFCDDIYRFSIEELKEVKARLEQ